MNKETIKQNLEESIKESMESIEAIKGKDYLASVQYLMGHMQSIRLISIAYKRQDDDLFKLAIMSLTAAVDYGKEFIEHKCEYSDEQANEIFNWAEMLDARVLAAMKEINK